MSGPALERIIGVRALALMIVSVTVGAGIFGLPALAAHELGAAAVLAYVVCAIVMGLVGLCLAEAGSRVPGTGGLYAYATASFGPFAGAFVGMLLVTANGAFANAAVAALFADTVGQLIPAFTATLPRVVLILAVYASAAWINVRGARGGVMVAQVVTVIKLLPLVALVVAGAFFVHPEHLRWSTVPAPGAIARTSVLLIFAFVGIEGGLSASGEVRNPSRTIPRAILFGLGGVTILYMGLQFVAQGVLGPTLANGTTSPLADTAKMAFGPVGGTLILVATALSTLGFIPADILAQPRALLALGRDGFLPTAFGRIDPTHRTPATAILSYTLLAAVLALTGTFSALAVVSASGTLAMYLICALGVLRLRKRGIVGEGSPFIVPGGVLVPLLTAAGILWLLASLTRGELLAIGAVVAVCAIPWLIRRQRLGS